MKKIISLMILICLTTTLFSACGNRTTNETTELSKGMTIENVIDYFYEGLNKKDYNIFKKSMHPSIIELMGGDYNMELAFLELLDELNIEQKAIYQITRTEELSNEEVLEFNSMYNVNVDEMCEVYFDTNIRDMDPYFICTKIQDNWYILSGD